MSLRPGLASPGQRALGSGDPAAARHLLQGEVAAAPSDAGLWRDLGTALWRLGRPDEAEAALRRAVALAPNDAAILGVLANLLVDRRAFAEAEALARAAVVLDERESKHHLLLARALSGQGRADEAEPAFARALALAPRDPALLLDAADRIAKTQGPEVAVEALKRAVSLAPHSPEVHWRLIQAMLYDSRVSPQALLAETRAHMARHARARPEPVFANPRDPDRRLNLGFVSGDWMIEHPLGRNMLPLLEAFDRSRVAVTLYSDVRTPLPSTKRFEEVADRWRSIVGLGDEAAAALMRADGIDVLVHLGGHFDRNRPWLAARWPAPVQVSHHTVATLALPSIGWFLGDRLMNARSGPSCTERVLRLPTLTVYADPAEFPPVAPPPCRKAGFVTFASFANPAKISIPTLALWARTMAAVPESRLLLKSQGAYGAAGLKAHILAALAEGGIEAGRVTFLERDDSPERHLERYSLADIALDTFPFNGSTTTFEALAMGVPMLTMRGQTMVSRWSYAYLAKVGLAERFAARDEDEFVTFAVRAATEDLGALRAGLRERLCASCLCRPDLSARWIERALRAAWRHWLRAGTFP